MQAVESRSSSSRRSRCLRCTQRRACCTIPTGGPPWSPSVSSISVLLFNIKLGAEAMRLHMLTDLLSCRRQLWFSCALSADLMLVRSALRCTPSHIFTCCMQARMTYLHPGTCHQRPRAWGSTRRARSRGSSRAASTRTSTRCWTCPLGARWDLAQEHSPVAQRLTGLHVAPSFAATL